MILAWIGLAILAGSWTFGLGYFHQPNLIAFWVLAICAVPLLSVLPALACSKRQALIALALLIPSWILTSSPYRLGILFMAIGLVWLAVPAKSAQVKRMASGWLVAGSLMLIQGLAMWGYEYVTARSHELPWPVLYLPYAMARLVGIDAALDGTDIAIHTMRQVHRLGATWELLLDPATWCFLAGGLFLALVIGRSWRMARSILLAVCVWTPLRCGLLMAILVHMALRTGYDDPLHLMWLFWNGIISLILLAGPISILHAIGPTVPSVRSEIPQTKGNLTPALALSMTCLGILLVCLAGLSDPWGQRKPGRILVDEHRSQWERTDRPYDTEWYGHESGYNYACIYDYCSRFYQTGRLERTIDANALKDCDVLIVKVPTSRYEDPEIRTIIDFVRRGGGLMLVGEHTNVFNTGVYLNDIARHFGFIFRYDCLFDIDKVFEQAYRPAWVRHPIVQAIPSLDFAVSCSIAPGLTPGQAVIRSVGLRNLPADYHASNFYPQVEDQAYARYGAFIQLWARRYGAGRVVAFTDSTIFSNFATFEQGKAELMLGMIEWLNHANGLDYRPLLFGLGLCIGLAGLIMGMGRTWWVLLFTAGILGLGLGGQAARAYNLRSICLPKPQRPFTQVVIDRTICSGPLSKSGFIAGPKDGFGIFERWILRLGYFTSRRAGKDVFTGDLLVFFYPTGFATESFRKDLVRYVAEGGKVLILDSPDNPDSKANGLLQPFGMSTGGRLQGGTIGPANTTWPAVQVDSALTVNGGSPIVLLHDQPVAATARYGKGSVTFIGFGSRFADMHMGVTGDVQPDQALRQVFDLEFAILRSIVQD